MNKKNTIQIINIVSIILTIVPLFLIPIWGYTHDIFFERLLYVIGAIYFLLRIIQSGLTQKIRFAFESIYKDKQPKTFAIYQIQTALVSLFFIFLLVYSILRTQ